MTDAGANALVLAGWRVLRFSWEDVVSSPEHVVETVRGVLAQTGCRCRDTPVHP